MGGKKREASPLPDLFDNDDQEDASDKNDFSDSDMELLGKFLFFGNSE